MESIRLSFVGLVRVHPRCFHTPPTCHARIQLWERRKWFIGDDDDERASERESEALKNRLLERSQKWTRLSLFLIVPPARRPLSMALFDSPTSVFFFFFFIQYIFHFCPMTVRPGWDFLHFRPFSSRGQCGCFECGEKDEREALVFLITWSLKNPWLYRWNNIDKLECKHQLRAKCIYFILQIWGIFTLWVLLKISLNFKLERKLKFTVGLEYRKNLHISKKAMVERVSSKIILFRKKCAYEWQLRKPMRKINNDGEEASKYSYSCFVFFWRVRLLSYKLSATVHARLWYPPAYFVSESKKIKSVNQ